VRALEMPSSQDQDGPTKPEQKSTRIHGVVIFSSAPLSEDPGFESRMCYQIRSLWVFVVSFRLSKQISGTLL